MFELPPYCYNSKEFVPGKSPVFYSGPYWDHEEIEAATKAITSGHWISAGSEVEKFQRQFSRLFSVEHSHMVNSGSSANLVMIAALKKVYGWKDGDEIIVSPVGFPTTIAPIVQNGLKPVFVDIETGTLNFNTWHIEDVITPRTRAIFVSPVLGNPPDMDELDNLCDPYHFNLKLIGDNCDSMGTRWDGELLTRYYCAWSSSFYPAHHITTGEGGMVSTNSEEIIKQVRSFSWWGRACYCVGQANLLSCGTCGKRFSNWLDDVDEVVDHKYVFENMGYNLKPLDLQGAIGQVQLRKLPEIELKRRAVFTFIKSVLVELQGIKVARQLPQADPCWFGVPIICDTPEIKQSLVNHLEVNKIQTRNYFAGNILKHPGYKHLANADDFPNANKALTHVFFMGCPPHYNDEVLKYIHDVLKRWKP